MLFGRNTGNTLHFALCTLHFELACVLLFALCVLPGCANLQHKADRSMLIQENLQLDQALSITQYELMLAQQENDVLREQLKQVMQNTGGGTSGGDNTSGGTRATTLRSQYEQVAPTFDANDPNLPPPSNQVPHYFQRPQQNLPPDQSYRQFPQQFQQPPPISQALSRTQTAAVPPGAPQWSPQRGR